MNDFINRYPYSDTHELNLDWIIAECKRLADEMAGFKAANTIKYKGAWNITDSYEAWFVVNYDNKAFMSVKPVPAGIYITNAEYWMYVSEFSVDA